MLKILDAGQLFSERMLDVIIILKDAVNQVSCGL
jgi:hypothetical protein